ncbi:Clp protease N-terminal domain-containing protein [Plantactinospora sp. GCM10030261]|uniref:Clp protease N-terminal domain-containing protein n=1 Tax=Plantactinospora sp. GCM10030261 TaxID=3273420 RepID=UPI00361F0781
MEQGASPPFVALGAISISVLREAYAAAARRGADSVGTLDMLCHLPQRHRSIPPWLVVGANAANLMRMAVDPRRIPTKRSVGELMSGPPTEFDSDVQETLREVEWRYRRSRSSRSLRPGGADVRPSWTNGLRSALAGALAVARDNDVPFAGPPHLALGMLRRTNCDGTGYLYPHESARLAATDRLRTDPVMRLADHPHPDLDIERLTLRQSSDSLRTRLAGRIFARMSRLSRLGPILNEVDNEAKRQAVRLDHDVVGLVHVLLAMITHDVAREAAGIAVPAHHGVRNRGAAVLRANGVDGDRLRALAVSRGGPAEPPAEALSGQWERLRPGDPLTGADVVSAMARAAEISLSHQHPDTGTSHLLLAVIEDDAGDGSAALLDLDVDPEAIRAQVKQDLRAAPAAW